MTSVYIIVGYVAILAGIIFLTDAGIGFFRAASGTDDDAVSRRLEQSPGSGRPANTFELLRHEGGLAQWLSAMPIMGGLGRLIIQAGIDVKVSRVLLVFAALFVTALIGFLYLLPLSLIWLTLLLAVFIGVAPILTYLLRARAKRQRTFDEQLPDAIDLIVRSLKIGHPLSGAMLVIARDMPAPIGTEFAIASEQINYGRDIPSALFDMSARVGATDLGYMAIAVQIQQESGGNLVESLSKLSSVVRERFRMFRKVRAITAEGRFSAWMLSLFPFAIAGMITMVKPNYYTQVMNFPYFPHIVALVCIMLAINVIAMRMLTTIKV